MKAIVLVFAGGGLGAVARYLLNKMYAGMAITFPMATLTANFLSCLFFGFVIGAAFIKTDNEALKLLLITGFCGGFSTFSAFAFESNQLFANGFTGMALANIILNFVLSIAALYLGGWMAKLAF